MLISVCSAKQYVNQTVQLFHRLDVFGQTVNLYRHVAQLFMKVILTAQSTDCFYCVPICLGQVLTCCC